MYYKRKAEPIKAIQYNGRKDLEKVREFVGDDEYKDILIRPISESLVLDYGAEVEIGDYMFFDRDEMLIAYEKEKFENDFESVCSVSLNVDVDELSNIVIKELEKRERALDYMR